MYPHLDQALLALAPPQHGGPPFQVLCLVGKDLGGEGEGPVPQGFQVGGRLWWQGQQLIICEVLFRDGDPKLLAQVFEHGRGRQQVSHNHLPELGAGVADVVDPGVNSNPSASPVW